MEKCTRKWHHSCIEGDIALFQLLKRSLILLLLTLFSMSLLAQSGSSAISITPATSTMQIGDARQFRVVDSQGRVQDNVHWTISDSNAFTSTEKGDELDLTAKTAGTYRISARAGDRAALASIKVVEKTPPGTALSSQSPHGCKVVRIIQAPPSYSGPYMYEQTLCDDGMYIAAYTESGVQLWQRKIASTPGGDSSPADENLPPGIRLETKSTSVCDALTTGTAQEKVKELLKSRNLSYMQDPRQRQIWLVEEADTECKLWFDSKSVLTRKQKTLIAQ
jgi:hypothetical protein